MGVAAALDPPLETDFTFFKIIWIILHYTQTANKAVFGRKIVPNKLAKSWNNIYEGIYKVHRHTELLCFLEFSSSSRPCLAIN